MCTVTQACINLEIVQYYTRNSLWDSQFGQTVNMDDTSSASASTSASVSPPSENSDVWKYFEKSAESSKAKCSLCNVYTDKPQRFGTFEGYVNEGSKEKILPLSQP